jgi:hypothetical protein
MASPSDKTTLSRQPRDGVADALTWLRNQFDAAVPLLPAAVLWAYVLVSAVVLILTGAPLAAWRDWLAIPAAMAAGGLGWNGLARARRDDIDIATPRAMPALAVCNLVVLVVLLLSRPMRNPGAAIIALIFAGAAFVTLSACVQAIRDSNGIGIDSNWGGFGGGLGGWHLSKAASLALVTLALAGAAVAAVHFGGT